MCGIVGYVGDKESTSILIEGLRRLEYRGYDSAGIAVLDPVPLPDGRAKGTGAAGLKMRVVRCRGKLLALENLLRESPPRGRIGIGHTRWATHGRPSDENAHPHFHGAIAVVHNGIIENYVPLRQALTQQGHRFQSETDTEIVAHLIDEEQRKAGDGDLLSAVRRTLKQVEGAYAIVVLSEEAPQEIVCAKNASPLVIGLGDGENFLASDVPAILPYTRKVIFLEEGDVARVTKSHVYITDIDGNERSRPVKEITWSAVAAEKSGFKHFMMKEIHEQSRAVTDTLRGRLQHQPADALLDGFHIDPKEVRRLQILACGTSFHAAMVGEYMIEQLARIPVEIDLASEFRYRDPIVGAGDLIVSISQSGETADTLAAIKDARQKGAKVLSISNVVGSSIPRASDHTIYTHAGPEIGVASTKAFTAQLSALAVLAIHLGRRTGSLSPDAAAEIIHELSALPAKINDVVAAAAQIQILARRYGHARDFLFLGRGPQYPIALEGALKLKEISYIHAEGYAAGEMKHGPIALIDEDVPVVVLAPNGSGYDKVMSNLSEVRARGGKVIAVATKGDTAIGEIADDVVLVPAAPPLLAPILTVIPLQLLAYYVADLKGTDIDQPRNLAKSVTVE